MADDKLRFKPNVAPVTPPESLQGKAEKYDFTLGDDSPGVQSLSSELGSTGDARIREALANKKAIEFEREKLNMVQTMAATQKGPVTQQEADFVLGLTQADVSQMVDASTVFETEYAKKFAEQVILNDRNRVFWDAQQESPEQANEIVDKYQWGIARNQIIQTYQEDLERRKANSGWVSSTWDTVEGILPGASLRKRNLVNEAPASSLLPGNNLSEQYRYLHSLPPQEFKTKLEEAYLEMAKGNLGLAEEFLNGALEYGAGQAMFENVMTTLDAADVAGLVGGAIKGVAKGVGKGAARQGASDAVEGLGNLLKGAVRASKDKRVDVAKVAEATGQLREHAIVEAVRDITGQGVRGGDELSRSVPSIADTRKWLNDEASNLGRVARDNLMKSAETRAAKMEQMLTGIDTVARSTPEQLAVRAARAFDNVMREFDTLQNRVLDLDSRGFKYAVNSSEKNIANTESIAVRFGRTDGTLFGSKKSAQSWVRNSGMDLKTSDYAIKPHGSGYYVEVTRDVPESLDNFKALEIPVNNGYSKGSWNSLVGWLRNSKDILPPEESAARLQVTHGTQEMYSMYKEVAEPLTKIAGKQEWKDLEKVLKYNRDMPDPVTGVRGFFFKSIGQFEEGFKTITGKNPTEAQIDAYYAYVQLNDLDYAVRSAGWYRDKARLGLSQFTVDFRTPTVKETKYPDGSVAKVSDPKGKVPLSFEGKIVDEVPIYNDQFTNVAFYDPDNVDNPFEVMNTKYRADVIQKKIEFLKEKGYKIIQAADNNLRIPTQKKEYGVGFIVTKAYKNDRLSIAAVGKREGGHVINKFEYYAKQPMVKFSADGRPYYTGDVAVRSFPTQELANKWTDAFEQARKMLKDGNPNLKNHVEENLGMDMDEFANLFKPVMRDGQPVEGLSIDAPVAAVRTGRRSTDKIRLSDHFDGIEDTVNNKYNLLNDIDQKFAGERDSNNIPVVKEEEGVLTNHAEGDLLDPYQTLASSARNMVNLRQKRDYILKSSSDWLRAHADLLDGNYNELARDPIRTLYDAKYKSGVDQELVRNAKNAQNAILRFIGTKSADDSSIDMISQKMANWAYRTGGDSRQSLVENYLLPVVRDPVRVARTIAFHAKLGMFNWVQIFTQGQTHFNIMAISPKAGLKAMPAYMPMRMALINTSDEVLNHSASIASKFGWKPDEFKEMVTSLRTSGWANVGGDYSALDDIWNPSIVRSKAGAVLDSGTVFFRETEKSVRMTSWATAYQEWKLKNSGKSLDRAARQWIINRADDLTANMSAANNAAWQKGLAAIPTQFFAYQARMTEAFLGKRLTYPERARLFAVQSMLYGVPTALGGVFGVAPIYDILQQTLASEGISYDNTVLEGFIDGIPSVLGEAIGLPDTDAGPRFGAGGIPTGLDLYNGDKDILDVVLGASGTVIGDIITSFKPAAGALMDLASGGGETYPIDGETLTNTMKNVTSVNAGLKLYYAINYGKWLSKNGSTQADVTTNEALFMSLTGTTLQSINQSFTKMNVMKNQKGYIEETSKEIRKLLTQAEMTDDADTRQNLMKRAIALSELGGLTPREFHSILKQMNRNENMVDSINRRYEEDYLSRIKN